MTNRPLAILLVGDYPDDPRLGSSKVSHKLREEFVALGHRCDVVSADEIGRIPRWRQIRQVVSPWMAGRAIVRRMGRTHYDIVDAASAEGLFLGVIGLIPDRERAAFICRSHGLEHLNYARMLDDHVEGLRRKPWVRRVWYPATRLSQVAAAARVADALVVINDVDRRFAVERGWQPSERVFVVPHGISSRFIANAPSPQAPRGAGLLFCGTWDLMKGVTYVASALEQLHESGDRHRLTVLGPGVPADVVMSSFAPATRPFVTVIDRAPEERVMEEYSRHDALLFVSTYEGFGLVAIEAMSQRLPVIATPAGCAATLVEDGVTGLRVPARDPAAIAGAIRRIYRDPVGTRAIAESARTRVEAMTWTATAERTVDVYRSALARIRR